MPDFRAISNENSGIHDGSKYYTIENGVRLTGMPAFGEEHSVGGGADTWHLVLFVRHLPQITSEELDEMKGLNPKTEADRAEEQQEQEFLNGGDVRFGTGSHETPKSAISAPATGVSQSKGGSRYVRGTSANI